MATSNKTPVVIPQPIAAQATSENINVIPNGATGTNLASFQEGFPAITRMPVIENPLPTQVSGLPPKQQDFNGLFNVVSQHNFFAQNGGTYSFNQAVSDAIGGYPKNAVLWYFPENEEPCLVRSLINDNTNNFVDDPTLIDGIHWEMLVNPSSYANLALTNSPYTTNRILEIPQDIKLVLNNGTLTLKAGSKVYVPNGPDVFTELSITSDITMVSTALKGRSFIFANGSNLFAEDMNIQSGSTFPSSATTGVKFYNTTENKFYRYNGSEWQPNGFSFPLAIVTLSSESVVTSIDQIFNGFGYIGSTVFALPGVKVQAPNGKNKDGTYNSSVYTTSTVFTMLIDASWGTFDIYLTKTRLGKWPDVINGSVGTRYNSENNYYEVYSAGQSKWVPLPKQLAIAKVKADTTSPYRITSFEPYTVDSVANSSLSNLSAAGQDVIINLSGNPTGTIIIWSTSTPPAGYLVCNGAAISRTTYARLFNVIGTTWGAGDGNTTFNLPNFVDRIPQGSGSRGTVGALLAESLPNITGTTGFARSTSGGGWVGTYSPNGCFYQASTNTGNGLGSSQTTVTAGVLGFAASNISSTYQNKAPVQQAATVVNFCIRY